MKDLRNISLFKIIILCLIALHFNNIFLYLIFGIYLLLDNYKSLILYVLLVLFSLIIINFKKDFIPIGIIDYKKNDYYIVDKFIYKTKLISDEELKTGDVLYFDKAFNINKYDSELNKNIQYYGYDYKLLLNFKPRLFIYNRVNSFDVSIKTSLFKFLYNINTYEDLSFNIGYGFALYYLFSYLFNKNKYLSILLLITYSLLFNYQIKFYLLLIEFILSFININKLDKLGIKLYLIFLINPNFYSNYSILIPILISVYYNIKLNISFRNYFMLLQSAVYGEINIIFSLFYKYYLLFQILLVLFGMILLLIPSVSDAYLCLLNIYSYINNLNINIRGSVGIVGALFITYCVNVFKINNEFIKYLLILLTIMSPINQPFGHVSFIDVGQGDASLIKFPLNKGNILIDTGSTYNYYKLKKYLYQEGIYTIDYLIITHNDSDHNGNIDSLCKDFKVNNIITEGEDFAFEGVLFKYYELGEFDNDNDNSLVYGFSINGLNYLMTGDISINAEKIFINKYGPIDFDVLKVSHHGSYTASSKYFIGNILPKYAIISTSGQYGHPASSTITNLNDYLVNTYITKYDKTIEFYFIYGINLLKTGNWDFVIIKG